MHGEPPTPWISPVVILSTLISHAVGGFDRLYHRRVGIEGNRMLREVHTWAKSPNLCMGDTGTCPTLFRLGCAFGFEVHTKITRGRNGEKTVAGGRPFWEGSIVFELESLSTLCSLVRSSSFHKGSGDTAHRTLSDCSTCNALKFSSSRWTLGFSLAWEANAHWFASVPTRRLSLRQWRTSRLGAWP